MLINAIILGITHLHVKFYMSSINLTEETKKGFKAMLPLL